MEYLDRECLEGIADESFQKQKPYPWTGIEYTLRPDAFERLHEALPDVSIFKRNDGMRSGHGKANHYPAILQYRPSAKLKQWCSRFGM